MKTNKHPFEQKLGLFLGTRYSGEMINIFQTILFVLDGQKNQKVENWKPSFLSFLEARQQSDPKLASVSSFPALVV